MLPLPSQALDQADSVLLLQFSDVLALQPIITCKADFFPSILVCRFRYLHNF